MSTVNPEYREKVQAFGDLLDVQYAMFMIAQGFGNQIESNRVSVSFGRKYARVDIGGSGRYMVDLDGRIFGIKAYGVIHRGYRYGTLDTIDQYQWGGYRGRKNN